MCNEKKQGVGWKGKQRNKHRRHLVLFLSDTSEQMLFAAKGQCYLTWSKASEADDVSQDRDSIFFLDIAKSYLHLLR